MVSNDMNAVLTELRELITVNREQIAEMKALSAQIRNEVTEVKQDMQTFKAEVNTKFASVQYQINVMQNDITGLGYDVRNMYTRNHWPLLIILALIAMPRIVSGIKSIIGAVTELISAVAGLFRKSKSSNN